MLDIKSEAKWPLIVRERCSQGSFLFLFGFGILYGWFFKFWFIGEFMASKAIVFGQAFSQKGLRSLRQRLIKNGVSFVSFSLRLFPPKKSGKQLKLHLCDTRGTPTCVFPSFALGEIHPSWRFRTIGGFRTLRSPTNAARVGSRSLFEKSDAKTFTPISPWGHR